MVFEELATIKSIVNKLEKHDPEGGSRILDYVNVWHESEADTEEDENGGGSDGPQKTVANAPDDGGEE